MGTSFSKAPLIEIVAELKWKVAFPSSGNESVHVNFKDRESFFKKFALELEKIGYVVSERLVPPNFPTPPEMVTYRFRKPNDTTSLIHVGDGVFSVNALPPYKSWEDFRPTVVNSVQALLAARDDDEKSQPFLSIHLRYIDVYKDELTESNSDQKFLSEKLGFEQKMPDILESLIDATGDVKLRLSLNAPLKSDNNTKRIQINIGRNLAGGHQGMMLDTVISETNTTSPTEDAVMGVLDESHALQRTIFLDMTKALAEKMEPIKD